jgi:hypothetical protein
MRKEKAENDNFDPCPLLQNLEGHIIKYHTEVQKKMFDPKHSFPFRKISQFLNNCPVLII